MSKFVSSGAISETGSGQVFLKCDAKDAIKNEEEFFARSPYSPTGAKPSRRIYKREIGKGKNKVKPYYGNQKHIVDRITYNKCSLPKNRVWQQYENVVSHSEAFDAANKWFRGKGRFVKNVGETESESVDLAVAPPNYHSLQLMNDADYEKKLADSERDQEADEERKRGRQDLQKIENVPRHNRKVFVEKAAKSDGIEMGKNGSKYMKYPDSSIYFECPKPQDVDLVEMKKRYADFKADQLKKGNNLSEKTVYCGRHVSDIVKAKMCGMLGDFADQVDLVQLGSPGQCFAYGKVYDSPARHSYLYYTHDYE